MAWGLGVEGTWRYKKPTAEELDLDTNRRV